ncbi:MAG: tRNA (adenosine(37)-N6)-threonylcarbamoyltransferase complex transferase subunit TsaD [Planctomycetes bacterium]|nr:tRNA (adenosine(37)-N6)-threonylcarbamoyltransferase complex transferase subunit TsaD [Planctomycetota bacterium]
MLTLGIESSCDETAAAVVRDGREVLSSIVASQAKLHAPFRGVVPEIASRGHLVMILPVIQSALEKANVTLNDIELIAVTREPGLIGALLVGVTAAKSLAWYLNIPIVGVEHLAAHLYAAAMENGEIPSPSVALVASGGHTALYQFQSMSNFEILGSTCDDAAGEAFDKVAAMLGLAYPGGPSIENAAKGFDIKDINRRGANFNKPRVSSGEFDFSFSGLKTAVRYRIHPPAGTKRELSNADVAEIATAFQCAAVDHLVETAMKAARACGAKALIAGGGVACNQLLRSKLRESCAAIGVELFIPRTELCADNAAMIAGMGWKLYMDGRRDGLDMAARSTGAVL